MFAGRGFRTAGMISANTGSAGIELRELGFMNECRRLGISLRDDWIVRGESSSMEAGYECARVLSDMEERPDGILIMEDILALGAMMQFRGSGIGLPEDMSVIVVGMNSMLKYMSPSVTMIGVSMEDAGECSLNVLMTVINNNIRMPISKMIPIKYEYGDSFRP